ncbi:cell envelope-related function transcriptional attenuator common domain-containing protein [Paramicrobacterium humi]|uniref:Cell envelope-related function transcriptional attenuator common domain-containing protein n=1 Tax=Paramicrobacterium humi TaxID=640635 RepID=A0A1H4JFP1_9MICO|nr:LCP family protein [Microbacterium humi]SEB44957.1 cell envelope-related function transcriptional attenuator common domain-containing protein [Microbacterium humi]
MARRSSTIARHGRLPRRGVWQTAGKFVACAVAVALVSVGGVAAWAVTDVVNTTSKGAVLAGETPGQAAPDINSIEGGVNLLLIGSDSRAGQGDGYGNPARETGNLNDVTMLLHVAEDHSNATVVSFPRDMFVPIPSCPRFNEDGEQVGSYPAMSRQKINTTLSYGGMACTVLAVEDLTGLDIPFAAEVQFNGVIALSNAIGGVEVCLAKSIKDSKTDLDLPAGNVSLKGKDALQFLRTRHGVSDGSDLGRISNQQLFLSALVRELKSAETLTDPVKLYSIAKVAATNMQFSQSLNNINTMVSIGMTLADIPTDKITFVQYPNYYVDGGVSPLTTDANTLFDAIKQDKNLSVTGGTGGSIPQDGESTAPPTTPPATDSPDSTTPPEDGTVELPDSIHGQNASLETCADGNGY